MALPRLELKFLGGLNIQQNGAPISEIKSQKGQALLCYLAVTRKQVSRSTLAGLFWSDMPESNARMNLRKVLSRLEPISDYLVINKESVAFNPLAPHWIDVDEFKKQSNPTSTRTQLKNAADLYQGDFLDGFNLDGAPLFDEWVLAQRARLRETALQALHKLVEFSKAAGEDETALAYARQILTIEPWEEETHREMMRLLALSGQRSAALAQYEKCCQLIADELGVAPTAVTVQVYEQIKTGRLSRASESQDTRKAKFPPHNLPPQMTPFVGREAELARLQQLLDAPEVHLITILGPGGIGKTRLALALAANQLNGQSTHPFSQGVYFVPLARLESADLLVPAIAEAIGFRFTEGDEQPDQLIRYLATKAMLLVLDNFEHLLAGAGLVDAILRVALRVKFVITSRIRLNRQVEQLFPVGGMDYPAMKSANYVNRLDELSHYSAVQLFVQRARRLQPDFELTADNHYHIVEICRLMQGMPLGIVLAASWLDSLSPGDIQQEIQQDLDFLATGMEDIPARQRSLRAAFNHSWRFLTERERDIYSQMSIFRGGFTRAAAQAITGATLHDLQGLVNKSLLMQSPERRYDVHELVRQFAAEKLSKLADLETAVRDHHSAYYCHLLQQQTSNWHTARQLNTLAEVSREADNIHSAWRWSLQHGAWQRLLAAIDSWGWYHKWRGLHAEGEAFCLAICNQIERQVTTQPGASAEGYLLWAKALFWQGEFTAASKAAIQKFTQVLALLTRTELANLDTRQVEAFALLGLGGRFTNLDRQKARAYLERSLDLFQALQDSWGIAEALGGLGNLDWSFGEYDLSQKRAQESLAMQQEQGDLWGQIEIMANLAWVTIHLGQLAEAERLRRQAVDLCYKLGDRSALAFSTANVAYSLIWQGMFTEGLEWAEKSVQICLDDDNHVSQGFAYLAVGNALINAGQYEQAQQKLTRSLALVQEVNNQGVEATVHYMLGCLDMVARAYDQAQADFEESLRLYHSIQGDAYTFLALSGLGLSTCCSGELDQSRHYFIELLTRTLKLKDFLWLIVALPGVALYLLRRGQVEQAIAIWAQAQCHPYVANSQWYKDVVGNAIEEAAVGFPSEIIDSAITQGRSMDIWQMGKNLLTELTAITCDNTKI